MTLLVNLIGIAGIIFVILWFWVLKTKEQVMDSDRIEIIVKDGIYKPAVIRTQQGKTITLSFLRQDKTPCSAVVIFPEFNKNIELPVNEHRDIQLKLTQPGEFDFHCEMNMYRGKLIVV